MIECGADHIAHIVALFPELLEAGANPIDRTRSGDHRGQSDPIDRKRAQEVMCSDEGDRLRRGVVEPAEDGEVRVPGDDARGADLDATAREELPERP
jgi:hypothetical protein